MIMHWVSTATHSHIHRHEIHRQEENVRRHQKEDADNVIEKEQRDATSFHVILNDAKTRDPSTSEKEGAVGGAD